MLLQETCTLSAATQPFGAVRQCGVPQQCGAAISSPLESLPFGAVRRCGVVQLCGVRPLYGEVAAPRDLVHCGVPLRYGVHPVTQHKR